MRNVLFGSRHLDFDVIALRIDFHRPDLPTLMQASAQSPVKTVIIVISTAGVCVHHRSFFSRCKCGFISFYPSVIAPSLLYLGYGLLADLSRGIACQYRVMTRVCAKNLFRIV